MRFLIDKDANLIFYWILMAAIKIIVNDDIFLLVCHIVSDNDSGMSQNIRDAFEDCFSVAELVSPERNLYFTVAGMFRA